MPTPTYAEGAFTGLAGATVQVVDLPASAVTTEGSGEYTLEVAPGLFEVEAIFADRYTVIVTGDTENASLKKGGGVHPMMTTTTVAGLIQPLGVSQSTTDGMVWVMVMAGEDQPAAGASVAIGADNDGSVMVGGAGSSAGSDIAPDTFLVVYANVPAGTSTVTVTPPKGLTCDGASSVTVYAEKATLASYFCQ